MSITPCRPKIYPIRDEQANISYCLFICPESSELYPHPIYRIPFIRVGEAQHYQRDFSQSIPIESPA